jgi:hypothetical protein
VFGSVVAGAFQIAFRAEMHANDFFYFLKIIFDISTSKRSKKYKPHLILAKKKIQIYTKRRYKHSTKRSLRWFLGVSKDLQCFWQTPRLG